MEQENKHIAGGAESIGKSLRPVYPFQGPEADLLADASELDMEDTIQVKAPAAHCGDPAYEYQHEYGRRYHAKDMANYAMPNDEQESSRLDLQHRICMLMLDGALYRAPLKPDIKHALDVGTGSGIWAIKFANEFKSASVIGADISPVEPSLPVPSNCTFQVKNMEEPWHFYPNTFDYIHFGILALAIQDWPRLWSQAYAAAKPGGWVESVDIHMPAQCDDGTAPPDSPVIQYSAIMAQAGSMKGLQFDIIKHQEQLMKDAGFVDVHAEGYFWPVGNWPKEKKYKEMGKLMVQNVSQAVEGTSFGFLTKVLGWSEEDCLKFNERVMQDLRDPKRHSYVPVGVFYGRKPEDPQ